MTKKIAIGLAALLALAGVIAALVHFSKPEPPASVANASLLVRFHAPSFGDSGARVHIVEFLDPACGTCRDFYPFVKGLMEASPGRIRLTIRYAPFHRGADQVVRLLEAARKQGKYPQTLEALLASQPHWVINHTARFDLAWRAVHGVGLDPQRLEQDMAAPELTRLIQQDLEDAAALNVTKTPEFFVNGRPLPSFGYEELRALVVHALREEYR
jgi:protein-disulfide isomerase